MHVCPRPSCRKAYHRECLINSNSVESPKTKSDRHLRLITTSPDDDEIFTLTDLVPTPAPPTTKSKKAPNIPPPKASDELLATLPTALVCIAQQQIVRGVFGGGLVGNVKAVTVARRLIYEAIQEGFLRGDWEEVIADAGPMTNTGGNVAKKAKKGANWDMLVCTKCKGPVWSGSSPVYSWCTFTGPYSTYEYPIYGVVFLLQFARQFCKAVRNRALDYIQQSRIYSIPCWYSYFGSSWAV